MQITANSKTYTVQPSTSVADFISGLGLKPERCVVELNGEAMRFSQFKVIVLKDGDKLEIMTVVAGG